MPTENELKIILSLDCEQNIKKISNKQLLIYQGYLVASRGVSLRVRKTENGEKSGHYMTFKCNTNGRVVEIEKKIDERDYGDLWPLCLNKLVKIRHLCPVGQELWEIDFFKDHQNKTYFAMAELEMPEGKNKPDYMPPFIVKNLLHEVQLTDCRFSSKLLADIRYATEIYKELKDGKKIA